MAAEPQPSHSNLFLRASQAKANPVSAALGPISGEGLSSSESCFLIHGVTSSFLTRTKPITSQFTHQLFPLISLHPSPTILAHTSPSHAYPTVLVFHSNGVHSMARSAPNSPCLPCALGGIATRCKIQTLPNMVSLIRSHLRLNPEERFCSLNPINMNVSQPELSFPTGIPFMQALPVFFISRP